MADEIDLWDNLVEESFRYVDSCQMELEKEFELSKHERWDFDQEAGTLTFSNKGNPTVIAEFQFVGSYSSETGTWLWAWANSSIEPKLYEKLDAVYIYGEKNRFTRLTSQKWEADETDGWEMAAIAAYLLKAKGVYRPPFSKGFAFMVITDINKVAG